MHSSEHYASFIRAEGDRMADIAEVGPLDVTVPSCPDWQVPDLVCHIGCVTRWYRYLLGLGEGEEQSEEGLIASMPSRNAAGIYGQHTAPLLMRRMTHGMAIHGWDAEQATGRTSSFDPALAADGVDELTEYWVQRPRHLRWPGYNFRWAELGGQARRSTCMPPTAATAG